MTPTITSDPTQTHRYIAAGAYEIKDSLKAAGWRWDPEQKVWWTDDDTAVQRVSNLASYFAPAVAEATQAVAERISESRVAAADPMPEIVPDGLDLYPFQWGGVRFAAEKDAVLIGDEMGLGKTIQAISLINLRKPTGRILIVCPLSVKLNWRDELRKWLISERSVELATYRDGFTDDSDIVIIHPEGLRRWADKIAAQSWSIAIVDEAHAYKNPKAARTRAFLGIDAEVKIALTGTPILNRPVEIFPLLQWLDGKTWSLYWAFARRYAGAFKDRFGWNVSGASHLDELQDRLRSSLMIRRLKADVLTELPPKIRQIITIDPEDIDDAATGRHLKQLVVEESELEATLTMRLERAHLAAELAKADDDSVKYDAAVKSLRDTQGAMFAEMARVRKEIAVAKAPHVVSYVADALDADPDKKVVIFAHHHEVEDLLAEGLERFGTVTVDGRTAADQRSERVAVFQHNDTVRVFVGGIQAAGLGITLTAANHVVMAEIDWVPGNVTQAEDRCHRIGQNSAVLVQHIVVEDSIEARMVKKIVEKQNIIDKSLDKEMAPEEVTISEGTAKPSARKDQIAKLAANVDEDLTELVSRALLTMVARDGDYARNLNGAGFNRIDTLLGHDLAKKVGHLSPKQVALAALMLRKYRGQLGEEITEKIKERMSDDT